MKLIHKTTIHNKFFSLVFRLFFFTFILGYSLCNPSVVNAAPQSVAGFFGKARSFNGSSDYIWVADSTNLRITGNLTISAWIKTSCTTCTIMNKGTSNGGQSAYSFGLNASGNLRYWNNSGTSIATGNTAVNTNTWTHVAVSLSSTTASFYVNGAANGSGTVQSAYASTCAVFVGARDSSATGNCNISVIEFFNGSIDEGKIDNVARTADEIRQTYEVGKRTHPITIDFVTSPQAAYSSGTSVTINNPYGTVNLTDTLSVGDTIIFKENVAGTETVSQAAVSAIANTSTTYGTVTLASAPSFPSGGYTTNAKVFKWQREYFDLTGSLTTHRDAVTRLTWRVTDGSQGANVWLDDIRSASYINRTTCDTLNTTTGECTYTIPAGSVTSTLNRYAQIRAIMSTWDTAVSPIFTSSQIEFGL